MAPMCFQGLYKMTFGNPEFSLGPSSDILDQGSANPSKFG